jgi:hypothetical protein
VAAVGAFTLRDVLTFETLAENRERLIAFRDANYAVTVLMFHRGICRDRRLFAARGDDRDADRRVPLRDLSRRALQRHRRHHRRHGHLPRRPLGPGRKAGGAHGRLEGRIQRLKRGIDENQWEMLFLIRLVPAVPFFVANLLPALVGVPLAAT